MLEISLYVAAFGLVLLLSLGLVVYETPVSQFLRHRRHNVTARLDGTTILLTLVLVFDLAALIVLVSSALLPR